MELSFSVFQLVSATAVFLVLQCLCFHSGLHQGRLDLTGGHVVRWTLD